MRPLLTPVSTAPFLQASQFTVCTSRLHALEPCVWVSLSALNLPAPWDPISPTPARAALSRSIAKKKSQWGEGERGRGRVVREGLWLEGGVFHLPWGGGGDRTWVKPGRFGSFFVLCFLALGGHCLQMLCLPGFGTRANTQNLPYSRAFPASIWEHSPPKCLFARQTLNCQIVPVLPSYP